MNAPSQLAARLRRVDSKQAHTQSRLIGALNHRVIDGLHTSARAASGRDRHAAAAWLRFRAGDREVAIAPLLVDGALAHVTGPNGQPDVAGAAAVLGQIEPLVAALELVLGDELHPVGVGATLDDDPVLLRLDTTRSRGNLRNRVLIAVPVGLTIAPIAEPAIVAPLIQRLRLRWTAAVQGPSVLASRLGTLGRGDLVLLGIAPLVGRLTLPGRRDTLNARLDLKAGVLTLNETSTDDAARVAEPGPPVELGDVRIATIVEISGDPLTANELATLGEGSVLPVPAKGGTLSVRLRAGETLIADGELVAIGDGFGVMINALHSGEGI